MSSFSWREDAGNVRWIPTIQLNVLRAFAAGVVWGVITLLMTSGRTSPGATPWWAMPVLFGIGYIGFVVFFIVAAKITTAFAGDIGELGVRLVTLIAGLAIAVGDPLVFLLHRKKPSWVPVETFRPFNVVLVLFILDPVKAAIHE